MYRLLTVDQIRELERAIFEEQGLRESNLTQRAGIALADTCESEFSLMYTASLGANSDIRKVGNLSSPTKPLTRLLKVAVFAGPGNNGADGWAAAAELQRRRISVHVFSTENPLELEGVIDEMAQLAVRAGVTWTQIAPHATVEEILDSLRDTTVIVDALLGISMRLPLEGAIARACEAINEVPILVIAADVPTGINPETGEADEHAVRASKTVTFLAAKRGLVDLPAPLYTGQVSVATLGADPLIIERFTQAPEMMTSQELAQMIPFPALLDNKFTRGTVLVIGGSKRFIGAALLTAQAAARCGAGYVRLAVPESMVEVAQSHLLTVPIIGLQETRKGTISSKSLVTLKELAAASSAVVIGPGLDRDDETDKLVREFVASADCTVVLDADAINAYEDFAHELLQSTTSLVMTPHSGEAARIMGVSSEDIIEDQVPFARHLGGTFRTAILKGPNTVISCSQRTSIEIGGSPVLATAGTGDVLAGMVGAFVAQGVDPYNAALLGVRLHANAGVLAGELLTPVCVTATDVINAIPNAVKGLLAERERR